jgi:hypothetical protein
MYKHILQQEPAAGPENRIAVSSSDISVASIANAIGGGSGEAA